jgi:nitrogen regulatory protein PII
MKPVKRIEIITNALELKELLVALKECGVSGYTVISPVTGSGERGEQLGDELTGVFNNAYVLTLAEPDGAGQIIETIRAILKRHGGICLVSDAQWVRH